MHNPALHLTAVELEQGLPEVLASPSDAGRLEAIFVRPAPNERRAVTTARLTPEGGVDGDRWFTERGDLHSQVSLMNARFLRQIAVDKDSMCRAGDNLIVDLDLSEANLPAGSQLVIGDTVVLEISAQLHTGCSKLEKRYGKPARTFMNNARGKSLHLRGRYAWVVVGGTVNVGDSVQKGQP
jgi:MOSC domain-containing protein YiiM